MKAAANEQKTIRKISLCELPDAEQCLDRQGLEILLLAGLRPADIAERHGVSRRHVASLAKRWGLDTRALRARQRSVAALRPDFATEFLFDVSGGASPRGVDGLTLGSGRCCRWRCHRCGHEWRATVVNRAVNGSGCPQCAKASLRELALEDRAQTPNLAAVRADLTGEFVRNLTVPTRDFNDTPAGSHDRILWRCRFGHEWITAARQRVKLRTNCPACRPGFRSSRLEYDVAELFMEATGLTVRVSHVEPRNDRADVERIDLYIEEIELLVDLDPLRWHAGPTAHQRDARKLRRLADRTYVRIRSAALGLVDIELPPDSAARQVVLAHRDDKDPNIWVTALLHVASTRWCSERMTDPLTPQQRDRALGRAARRWADLHQGARPRSLATEHPKVATEFVEVSGRPGLTAADIAPAGQDRVLWRCRTCAHEWVTATANRTRLDTGCPPCRYREGARKTARPLPGDSFADRHPGLMRHFIENLTHPGNDPSQLRPNSTDRCRWSCPHCGRMRETTPHALNRNPNQGCLACRGARIAAARRARRNTSCKTTSGRRDEPMTG